MGLPKRTVLDLIPSGLRQTRTGETFYVGNGSVPQPGGSIGANTNSPKGTSPMRPLSTLQAALTRCVANRGDVVYVLPGHAETVTAANTIGGATFAAKAGVSVVGLGYGSLRPTFTFNTATTADLNINVANFTFENLLFLTDIDELAAPLDVTAAYFTMRNCEVRCTDDDGDEQAITFVSATNAADYMLIEGCYFYGVGTTVAAGGQTMITVGGADDVIIRNNYMQGASTTSVGHINNTAAALRMRIQGNTIINTTAVSTKAFVCHASTTGIHDGNRLGILNGTAPYTAAGMYAGLNYYAAAVNTAMVAV
jgi:hypothetical protein